MSEQPLRRPATPMLQQIEDRPGLKEMALGVPTGLKAIGAVVGLGVAVAMAFVGFLVIDGQLDGKWYDARDLGVGVQALRDWLTGQGVDHRLIWIITGTIGGLGIMSVLGGWLLIGSWVERRVLAKFQIRMGPNRTGPFGLLQPIADAVKLMTKEVVIPRGADRFLYFIPPVLIFVPAMLGWAPIPWAPSMSYLDIDVGVLYVIAISSIGVLAVFLAGWSSNNHYSLLGSMRTVAMMVSYEIPISLSLLAVVLMTGSMRLSDIVAFQGEYNAWLIFLIPFAAFAFLFASTAEINRTPNDIGEAESEIVAGFYTEYSGMKAGLFMGVELGHAILVGALMSTFFLGGYTLFGLEQWIPGYLILATKIAAVYFFFVWLRGTLPRFRLDQLMGYAWKFLIPLGIIQVFIVAIQSSVFARVEAPALITLGAFAVINVAVTVVLVRFWADRLGYAPSQYATKPLMITDGTVGGLKAAQKVRSS
ncbi:MAG: NADH-quinone oxidoreductase subunit NuoH [Chloroflexi bacterium]|nr:NADH-quinone oxidoreductase subunit NuoH [Chloroflexota bacterium]MQC47627.1 NADH-quinone oxidoreductase subunit NuoH [Chloroflexota bacterium]